MKQPAISVAMATYNGERFLQEQLDSLARQTLLPCELVACDDGSTDGTLGILRAFADGVPFPVRIFRNESRLGSGFNFLGALSRCTGDLVAFCDQDDVWYEEKLAVCARVMRDLAVALVGHSAIIVSSRSPERPIRYPDHKPEVWSSTRDFPRHRWTLPGFSIVLRRAILERARVPEYRADLARWCVHDAWAATAALSLGRVVLLPDVLANYRLHEANVSLRPRLKGLDRVAPDASSFEQRAESTLGVARFLGYAASFCDEEGRRPFDECLSQTERLRALYRDRARLHRACGHRLAAIRTLVGMIAKGDYSPRGFGARAFVRDAFLAACWPAADSAHDDPAVGA